MLHWHRGALGWGSCVLWHELAVRHGQTQEVLGTLRQHMIRGGRLGHVAALLKAHTAGNVGVAAVDGGTCTI